MIKFFDIAGAVAIGVIVADIVLATWGTFLIKATRRKEMAKFHAIEEALLRREKEDRAGADKR